MNPALHHPVWYRNRELITEAEEKHALEKGNPMLLPLPQPLASFDAGTFRVRCDIESWEIVTDQPQHFDRIREVSQLLFDQILLHTPVREAAVIFTFTYNLEKGRRERALKALAQGLPFGTGLSDPALTACSFTERRNGIPVSVDVVAARNASSITVRTAFSIDGPKKIESQITYWDLREYLEPRFHQFRDDAAERSKGIVAWFQSFE